MVFEVLDPFCSFWNCIPGLVHLNQKMERVSAQDNEVNEVSAEVYGQQFSNFYKDILPCTLAVVWIP